jgi:hypothetical protein
LGTDYFEKQIRGRGSPNQLPVSQRWRKSIVQENVEEVKQQFMRGMAPEIKKRTSCNEAEGMTNDCGSFRFAEVTQIYFVHVYDRQTCLCSSEQASEVTLAFFLLREDAVSVEP